MLRPPISERVVQAFSSGARRGGNGLLFLLSPIFLCHKIKDGGYNNTNIKKQLSPAQNTPALQAADLPLSRHALYQPTNHWPVVKRQFKRHENANLGSCLYEVVTKGPLSKGLFT